MGGKMREKWDKMPNFHSSIFFHHFFRRLKIFPTVPFVKISSLHMRFFATHRHSPPRWLVRMLVLGLE